MDILPCKAQVAVKPLTNKSQKKLDGMLTTLRYDLHQLVRRILSIRPSVSILPVLICTHLDIAVDKFSKSCSQRNQFMAMTGTGRRVA